ncbi:MAG TPA: hypothetical protein PKH77_10565 [Anaerolineae bacterium]|nr:hypothetical protein [Anaerolineae bacterium]
MNGGTWELDDGTSTGTFAMVFNGVTQQLGGTGSILVDNLMVYTGTTLTVNQVPTVTGVLINNGTLKQTQTVSNATVNFLTISADKYRGVDIQTPNDLGVVTVTVQGNADSCTNDPTSPAYIKRCFSITPTNNATATLTLWATDAEMNGIDFLSGDEGALYRYVTNQWVEQARVEFGTDTNSYNYVTADVGGFSSFLLGKSGDTPTAVTYASMTSGAALWAPVSLLFLGGAALVLRKRR